MALHTDRPTATPTRRERDERLEASISDPAFRRVLENDRRREVLRSLLGGDGPLEVRTLVARIADAEHDVTAVTSVHELRQRVHVSLCRTHLPLLEDHRVLIYDRTRGLVAPGPALAALASTLEGDTPDSRGC